MPQVALQTPPTPRIEHPRYEPERCMVRGCHRLAQSRQLCRRHLSEWRAECPERIPAARPPGRGRVRGTRDWTQDEDDLLSRRWGRSKPQSLARQLDRSYHAVRIRAKRLGLSLRGCDGAYSASELARLLGVCSQTITRSWIPRGLEARRSATASPDALRTRPWRIEPEALADFFRRRPEAYDHTALSGSLQHRLGLAALPERPVAKVVPCTRCGRSWRVALSDPQPKCLGCHSVMGPWARDYADRIDRPAPRRAPTLAECEYYDAAADRLRCLHCGRSYRAITGNHVRQHGYADTAEYRRHYGLHPRAPLLCRGMVEDMGPKISKNWGKRRGRQPTPAYRRTGYRRYWSDVEREWLRIAWPVMSTREIAEGLGRKPRQVRNYGYMMGLRRRPAQGEETPR